MNKLINPILFIMCLLAMACSDDNNENETFAPFSLEKRYYEVRLERNATSIPIINGSGDISLAIEDENILNAIYSKYNDKEDDRKGHINLYGMQKGSTTLTITDNITKDVETVEVKVTDCYLAYVINDSNHPVLPAGTTLFLVNNGAHDYYLFDQNNIDNKPILKDNGYEFFITLDSGTGAAPTNYAIPNLRLYKHNPADAATTTSEFYDFQIKMYGIFALLFGLSFFIMNDTEHRQKEHSPGESSGKAISPLLPPVGVWAVSQSQCGRSPSQVGY